MSATCAFSAKALRRTSRGPRQQRVLVRAAVQTGALAKIKAAETMQLGKSGLEVSTIGLGAWAWGDRSGYWGQEAGSDYGREDSLTAYRAMADAGINFLDTAEVYGFGKSEEFVGEFMRATGTAPVLATKFAPLPWRVTADSVVSAARASLGRLGVSKVELYMQHWPGFFVNGFFNDAYIEGLARCREEGLCDAVGVSNFNAARTRSAARVLEARGTCLASNQVQYSLLYRAPESNGVLEACREAGTTLVAYSPLCQGLLTGKYTVGGSKPSGPRAALFTEDRYRSIAVLLDLMRKVGAEHGGKSPAQVALNWTMCKGALPIPGAKNTKQVAEIAGAFGWRLSAGEVEELDAVSARVPPSTGAPFENW